MRWFLPVVLVLGWLQATTVLATESYPQRVISLAPHLTEMIYSAGSSDKLVGVVEYSNYPKDALNKPLVGSSVALNFEQIIKLKPDLVLAWKGGSRSQDIAKLRQLGLEVYLSSQHGLNDIAAEIRQIGKLLGSQDHTFQVATKLDNELNKLKQAYQHSEKVSFFYQVWNSPLITINGQQFISQALNYCGAENVFSDLEQIAPTVNKESVIQLNPQMILLGGQGEQQQAWKNSWSEIEILQASKNQHIFAVDADTYQRPTERLIMGLNKLCKIVDQVRVKHQ